MRLQHNILLPASRRGGRSHKCKCASDNRIQETSTTVSSTSVRVPYIIPNASGFTIFKIRARTLSEAMEDMDFNPRHDSLSERSFKTDTNANSSKSTSTAQYAFVQYG